MSTFSYQDGTSHDDLTALDCMQQFDQVLASSVSSRFGGTPLLVFFKVPGSLDDIAVSPSGTAVTEVVILIPKAENEPVLSAVLKIMFAPNSAKIRTVAFLIIGRGSTESPRGLEQSLDVHVSCVPPQCRVLGSRQGSS